MIIEQLKNIEVERIGDTSSGIKASVDTENLGFMFSLVSKNFYSDPIGSIVREITSNCFDSHIEAGTTEPVVVNKAYSAEEGYSIEFKDFGVGLSAHRLRNIYMKYFSSTKRDDNGQIGGFGLGSKTPLAYASMFYITSNYEGKQYQCILHEGEKVPELESLFGWDMIKEPVSEEEGLYLQTQGVEIEVNPLGGYFVNNQYPAGVDTEEKNGSTIRIVLENADIRKFESAIKYQLSYFDNVWFSNWAISNDYDIYEGSYFKFRSDIDQSYTELHIALGNVRYPINFEKVNLPAKCSKMPIALKFNIGDLKVTPNRENIRYDDETVELIKNKAMQAYNELVDMFEEQNPVVDSLADFLQKRDTKPNISIGDKGHYIKVWPNANLNGGYKYKPLAHLGIKTTPRNMFSMYRAVGSIDANGKRKMYAGLSEIDSSTILGGKFVLLEKGDNAHTYTDIKIGKHFGESITLIKKVSGEIKYDKYSDLLGIKEESRKFNEILGYKGATQVGKAKTIMEYLKVIDKEVRKRGKTYSSMRPTQEWISEYKTSLKEASAAYLRKINKKVYVKNAGNGFSGMDLYMNEIQSRTGILVYGFKEDREILEQIAKTVLINDANISRLSTKVERGENMCKRDKAFLVVQVAKSAVVDILGAKKTIYWSDYLQKLHFREIETANYIYKQFNALKVDGIPLRMKFIKDFEEDYNKFKTQLHKHIAPDTDSFYVEEQYLSKNYIPKMLKDFQTFKEKHGYKIPFFKCLQEYSIRSLTNNSWYREDIADYLKVLNIRLKNEFYLIPEQGQLTY